MVVNVGGQLMNQVLLFISRMVFIHYLSASYLGVNGLFTDVLGILNFAELGIGTAMIYSWAQLCDAVKPLFESAINLAASLLLVQKFGVAGILGGTVISTVTTCLWMEPYILMRYGIREDWQGGTATFGPSSRRTAV